MDLTMSLHLPRDFETLPVVRHIAARTMDELRVERDCVDDIELALTEACTNVVQHSDATDDYDVTIDIHDDTCHVRVIDRGHGFDAASLSSSDATETPERGRGILIMRALVDQVRFHSVPEEGTVVHLVKELTFTNGRPTLGGRRSGRADG